MLLKVGELAKRTGLTVRTLHHYDEIGLLRPSARSDAGYRLYNRADVARLHSIQALRRLGLSLAEIGDMLASAGTTLPGVIREQIAALDRQVAQAATLRDRLTRLLDDLAGNQEPDLADWLNTLELMTMYDKYLTPDESRKLQARKAQTGSDQQGAAIIAGLQDLMARDVPPTHEDAQALALRWITMVSHLVEGDPRLLIKLDTMHRNEPSLQEASGIDDAMIAYVSRAAAEANLRIYAKYLNAEEMEKLRARNGQGISTWPPLIAEVRAAMDAGRDPRSPEVRALAKRWDQLHRSSFTGDDVALREKLGEIYAKEPSLLAWAGIDQEMLAFIREASV